MKVAADFFILIFLHIVTYIQVKRIIEKIKM